MANSKSLTMKQKRFIDEYLIDFCGAAAARRAGYSKNTANEIAYENLMKPDILAEIQNRAKRLSDESGITVERWFREVGRIAFFDIRKVFNEDGQIMEPRDWDDDTAGAIASLEIVERRTVRDEDGAIVKERVKRIKALDKKAALDMLGKYFKVLTNKVEIGETDKFAKAIAKADELALKYGGAVRE